MKNLLTPRRTAVATLLMGCWVGAQSQSLGTPVAQVLLGRPLDLSMPVRFAADASDNECVQADVFYGETRVKSGVRATVTGPADQRRIRIESESPIDEPIVTVSVRAGCRNTITRNYTLLPEYPSERLLASVEARAAMASAVPAVPLKMAPTAAAPTGPRKGGPRPVVVARASAPEPATPARSRSTRVAQHATPLKVKGPRLKLEPIDLPEQESLLRVSSSLADPAGDPSRRATAALLWQAINADPQEVLRTSVMIQKLEQDLAQLRLASNQTRAEMAALRERLDKAQPWYLTPWFVQLLALLVLAAAGAAGFFWWRTRGLRSGTEPWYMPHEDGAEAAVAPIVAGEPAVQADVPGATPLSVEPVPAIQPGAVRVPQPEPVEAVAADSGLIDFEVPPGTEPAARPALAHDRTDGVLRVETLAATFEEVEFLSSLGLTSDAMDILKSYLQDSASPAPLAYLELMRLCEKAEDPAAVATVRRRYAQAFRAEAPRLAQLTAEGGLDAHKELSERITRAWGQSDALDVIEQALFSVATPAAPITLQAGRDLLALYDLALTRATDVAAASSDSPLAPWAHVDDPRAAHDAAKQVADADGGTQFALDVDLSAAPEESVTTGGPVRGPVPVASKAAAEAARAEAARKAQEDEDAFSAAVASERVPVSRY